eukprot:8483765-Pyramimonas_sp.AAC.1
MSRSICITCERHMCRRCAKEPTMGLMPSKAGLDTDRPNLIKGARDSRREHRARENARQCCEGISRRTWTRQRRIQTRLLFCRATSSST